MCTYSILNENSPILEHAITGNDEKPSACMLSDTHNCHTAFNSNGARLIIAVFVRVDLFLSCIAFATGACLVSFKFFNFRLLIGFLVTSMCKAFFVFVAVLLIITNSEFYVNTIETVFRGICGNHLCIDESRMNIVASFTLLIASGLANACIVTLILITGGHIIDMYEEQHYEATWMKWDEMTTQMNT
uniref:Uncharacterized protein n=1 Tax=Caenorhabditis japonica TaxID=281687 RepID=A0A8R1DRZ9_CAEJA